MRTEQRESDSVNSLLQRVRDCQNRGLQYLLDHINPTGTPAGQSEYHARLPWTLAAAGARAAGAAVLSWHEREVLTANGDLLPGPSRDKWSMRWASYPLSMLAHGAWMLERYDTAQALMNTLRDYQDPETGGAYAERPEIRSSQRQDLFPTAQLGMTALMTGHDDVAEGCFAWIADLYDLQPELPQRLFSARDEHGLMNPKDGGSEQHYGKSLEWEVVTDFAKPRQTHYNPGIAAAFLGRYFAKTGNERARELGRSYLQLSESGTEEQFSDRGAGQICKFGWGAANMLMVDPDGGHLANVIRMAEWFIERQEEDGRWLPAVFITPNPTIDSYMEVGAEMTLHMTSILNGLSTIPRGSIRKEEQK